MQQAQHSAETAIELQKKVQTTSQKIKKQEDNSQQNNQRQRNDCNLNILREKKDLILQKIELEVGENIKNDIDTLINRFYDENEYEIKRNYLITILFVLCFVNQHELSNQIIREIGSFLKYKIDGNQVVVENLNDLKNFIKSDQVLCTNLFEFLSKNKIGYIIKPIIKDLRLNLESICKQTSSFLIQNNNLDAIELMLNYQSDALNQQELEKTKIIIFQMLEKKYDEDKNSQNISNIRQFSLELMFKVFFEYNFVNLWSGMLQYLISYNQIETGKMFVLQKRTIQDAVKSKRLDFINKCLKYYRQETQIILIDEDVFYSLIAMINEPKYFSDIICILSQFYKLVKQRKQQEYLIEIFNIMLTNNNNINTNNNSNNINVFGTSQTYQNFGNDQRGNKSAQNTPKSIKGNAIKLCESQICSMDLQKYNLSLSYILYTISPIITCTLIAKIFFVLSKRFHSPLKQKLLHVANEYLNLTILLSQEFDDLRNWKVILFDTIYPARYSLFQITINYKQFFYPLLSLENIKNTIYIKWKSDYNFSFNIMACSSIWNIIQELFYFKRRQLRDIPPFVPVLNQLEANPAYCQQNQDEYATQNNFTFFQNTNSKMNEKQRQVCQANVKKQINSMVEEQDLDNSGENGIKQRLVSQPMTTDQILKPNNPTISKMIYFFRKGIYRVDINDISHKYYLNQKVVIEKSVMMRNILDLIFYIGLFIVCFYYSHRFIDYYTEFQKISEGYLAFEFQKQIPTEYQSTYLLTCKKFMASLKSPPPDLNSVTPNLDNYKELCKIGTYFKTCGVPQLINEYQPQCEELVLFVIMVGRLGFILKIFFGFILSLGVQQLYLILFQNTIRPKTYQIKFFDIVDYVITILASVIIWHLEVNLDPFKYKTKQLDQFDLKKNCNILKNLFMFLFLLLWIRFFRYLNKTEKLGKVVKIFEEMIKDIAWFLIILFAGVAAFSTFFFMGYGYAYDDYSSLVQTFLTLFSSIFGSFSFLENKIDAQIYLIIFLILFNIIILNILIALLSNNYNTATHRANMEYSLILYNNYRSVKKNDTYGSTYYFPPPICVFNLLFAPFIYALPKYAKKINQISLHITYFFLMFLFTCIFFSISLILIVPSYIITFFQIIFNSNNVFTLKAFPRFILAFLWLIFGILILFCTLVFNDTSVFISSCYKDVNRNLIQKIFEMDQYEKVNIQFLRNILRKMNRKAKKKSNFSFSQFNASIISYLPQFSNNQISSNPNINFHANNNNIQSRSQSLVFMIPNSSNHQSINIKNQNNINKQQIQLNQTLHSQTFKNNEQMFNGQNSNNHSSNQQMNQKNSINNELNNNLFQNDNNYSQNMNDQTSFSQNNKNQNLKNTIQIPQQNQQFVEFMPKEKELNAFINNTDLPSNSPYSIKITPVPIIDRENKIVDSVTSIVYEQLGPIQSINSKEQIIKPEFNQSFQETAVFQGMNQNFPEYNSLKSPKNLSESNFNNTVKNKKNDKNNLNNFMYVNHDDQQDDQEDFFNSSNLFTGQPALDVIDSSKITQMYCQEIIDKQNQLQYQSIRKLGENSINKINLSPPVLGANQSSLEQDQNAGLWLELFIKRTSFSTNLLKYSMLLSFLQDAKKSVEMNTNKNYKEKKKLDKQSEFISLVDVGMGKRALQKYIQGQKLINK